MSDWMNNCDDDFDDEGNKIVYPHKKNGRYMKVPKSKTNGIYS